MQLTKFQHRFETEGSTWYGTFMALQSAMTPTAFDIAATQLGSGSPTAQWVLVAKRRWHDHLSALEHTVAISEFDLYAQSLLIAIWSQRTGKSVEAHLLDWKQAKRHANAWAKNFAKRAIGTQNVAGFVTTLDALGIQTNVGPQILRECERANERRNKVVHQCGFHAPLRASPLAFVLADAVACEVFEDYKIGSIFGALFKAVREIDRSVIAAVPLAASLLVESSG